MPREGEFGTIDKGIVGYAINMILHQIIKLFPGMPEPDYGRSTKLGKATDSAKGQA
jgi:hypothetical protein